MAAKRRLIGCLDPVGLKPGQQEKVVLKAVENKKGASTRHQVQCFNVTLRTILDIPVVKAPKLQATKDARHQCGEK